MGISRARWEEVGTDEDDGPPLAGGDPGERRLVAGRVGGCVVLAEGPMLSAGTLTGLREFRHCLEKGVSDGYTKWCTDERALDMGPEDGRLRWSSMVG